MLTPIGMNSDGQLCIGTIADGRLFLSSDDADLTSIASRTTSLETWRAAKATASPDVSTTYSSPTAVITLGLNCPTAAGINAIVGVIMGEINGLKGILRTREILST